MGSKRNIHSMNSAKLKLNSAFPYILLIGGLIGLIASLILTHDTLAIAHNSHYIPSCNLNPVLSCGNVINATGDKIFGLPYPYYGIAAFAALITVGAGMLAGSKLKRWYWIAFQTFITLGTIGAYALLFKSIYSIHALCPFCLSVDVVMTTVFWYTTLYNIDNKYIGTKKIHTANVYKWIRKHHLDLLITWFVLVIVFILHHFWYYYGKHL
jgi:uncharacterized membrane protein